MKLRSRIVGLAMLGCIVGSFGQAGETSALRPISPHVWAYAGRTGMAPANSYGANSGVIVGTAGALVVDTQISAKTGRQLLEDVRAVTNQPIRWVVNTHYHLDHAFGNSVFAAAGAQIIGGPGAPQLLTQKGPAILAHPEGHGLTAADLEGTVITPPTEVVADVRQLDLGGVTVEIRALAPGHSPDNLIIWVPGDRVLFSGDLVFKGCHPFVGEGDVPGWLADLDKLAALDAKTIIPGHGAPAGPSDLADMRAYLTTFDQNARRLAAGKTAADVRTVAEELRKLLPEQGRQELGGLIEYSLLAKYLPPAK